MILFLAKTRSDGSCSAPERHPHCFYGELNWTGLDATPDTNFQPGMLRQPLQPRPVFFTAYWCLQADPGTRRQMVLSDALLRGPPVYPQRMSSVTAAQVMDNNLLQDPSPKAKLLWLFDSLVTNVFCLGLSASTRKDEGCPCPVPAHPLSFPESEGFSTFRELTQSDRVFKDSRNFFLFLTQSHYQSQLLNLRLL